MNSRIDFEKKSESGADSDLLSILQSQEKREHGRPATTGEGVRIRKRKEEEWKRKKEEQVEEDWRMAMDPSAPVFDAA